MRRSYRTTALVSTSAALALVGAALGLVAAAASGPVHAAALASTPPPNVA